MDFRRVIDFTGPTPQPAKEFFVKRIDGAQYLPAYKCWEVHAGQQIVFALSLTERQGVNLGLQLCSALGRDGRSQCPFTLTINKDVLVGDFDPHYQDFYSKNWVIPDELITADENWITLRVSDTATTSVFLRCAEVNTYSASDAANWMAALPDHELISEINLPGTHDSAAIDTSAFTTDPWDCQDRTIPDQLKGGVRVLDVRLKVKQSSDGEFTFVTCHGGAWTKEYESFPQLLGECKDFLKGHGAEALIMILKIDQWSGFDDDKHKGYVLGDLDALLEQYDYLMFDDQDMPSLKDLRGKALVINRINSDLTFPYFGIPDNTNGDWCSQSGEDDPFSVKYHIWAQDRYKGLEYESGDPKTVKLALLVQAMESIAREKAKPQKVAVLSFASATWYTIAKLDVIDALLDYIGQRPAEERAFRLGWTMFNYPFRKYDTDSGDPYGSVDIVSLLMASNFGYRGLEKTFRVPVAPPPPRPGPVPPA